MEPPGGPGPYKGPPGAPGASLEPSGGLEPPGDKIMGPRGSWAPGVSQLSVLCVWWVFVLLVLQLVLYVTFKLANSLCP